MTTIDDSGQIVKKANILNDEEIILVDFPHFDPPGRLGRKIGPIFIAIGKRGSSLAVCGVTSAAELISKLCLFLSGHV